MDSYSLGMYNYMVLKFYAYHHHLKVKLTCVKPGVSAVQLYVDHFPKFSKFLTHIWDLVLSGKVGLLCMVMHVYM